MDESTEQITAEARRHKGTEAQRGRTAEPAMVLTREKRAILVHTRYREMYRCYFGDSADMQALVNAGLMKYLCTVFDEKIFVLTAAGLAALKPEVPNA